MSEARGRFARIGRRGASVLALALVFVFVFAFGFVVHLDTKPGRRIVARQANELVSELLISDLRIERIDVVSPTRLLVSRVSLIDRLGKPVLVLEKLDVRFGLFALLYGILGGDDVRVTIDDVHAERLAFFLTRDPGRGGFTVETAFDTVPTVPPNPNPSKVFVALPRIVVSEASVATDQPGIERMKAKVRALSAGLDVSPAGLVLSLNSGDLGVLGILPREVRGRLRSTLRLPGRTQAELDAHAGKVPVSAEVALQGAELELALRSRSLEPEAMRDLLGNWPLLVPARVSARATGEPTAMKATAEGAIGEGRFTGSGSLVLTPEVRSDLTLHAENLDLRAFDADAPETALDVKAQVSLRLADGLELRGTATVAKTEVSGHPVPPLEIRATLAKGALVAQVDVLEPKLATRADIEISPDGKVEFRTTSRDVDLEALAGYGVKAKGRATVRSEGVLERGRLRASFDASLRAPSVGDVRAEHASVHARVEGPVAKPDELAIDVVAEGEKVDAAGATFTRVRATSQGSLARQTVTLEGSSERSAELEASAELALGGTPVLRDVRLRSRRGDASVEVAAKRVALEPRGATLQDVSLRSGEGGISGSIAAHGGRRLVDLTFEDFDIGRALAAIGLSTTGFSGRIDGRVHFEEVGSERSGQAALELRDGRFPPFDDVTADLRAEFEREDIRAEAELAVSGLGQGKLVANGSLRRSVFDPRALTVLTGEAKLGLADVDLEQASKRWLADAGVAFKGRVKGTARVARSEATAVPAVSYELATNGFSISKQGEEKGPQSEMRLEVDSAGELLGPEMSRVVLELSDSDGPWIALNVEHRLGAEDFARAGASELKRAILEAPLQANLKAHRRPLRMFGYAGAPALDALVSANIDVKGSAREPDIDATASLASAGPTVAGGRPSQIDVALRYSAKEERYTLEARTPGARDHVELESSGRFGWFERGLGRDWSAKGEVAVTRMGLAPLGRLVALSVEGEASAKCSFDIEPGRIDTMAELAIDRVTVERRPIGSGTGHLKIGGGKAEAALDIEHGRSKLELVGDAGLVWADSGPMIDPRRGGTFRATARDFDLTSVAPFVRDAATRVTGTLNGRVELGWGTKASSRQRSTTLRGNVAVTNGTASLTAGGGLLQKVEVQALADGDGPLRLTFQGAARSREPNVKGKATILLDGPRLERFDAKFDFESFPLLFDGILLGRASTGARAPLEISIVSNDTAQTIDVHIPSVEVTLPKPSDKNLIALEDDRSIEVSDAPLDPEEQRKAAKGTGTTTLKVRLGKQVRIKRGTLDVPVSGAITVAPDGRLTGSITFPPGGVVPALGVIFRIRRGVVSFRNQEVKDGTLAIQAWTRVAEGTLIDLNVSGTVREPVIAFHSDPPRSEDEIVGLLLGIQTSSQTTADGESQQLGRTAMALAMNRLVEDSMLSGLQFGAGETGSGDSVSTVTMRVGSTVWFEGRTVRGSQHSVNPGERTSGVVDWRFAPSWSLRTQLGEVSGVEIRWSLRY